MKKVRNRSRTDFNGKDTTRKKLWERKKVCETIIQTLSLIDSKLQVKKESLNG